MTTRIHILALAVLATLGSAAHAQAPAATSNSPEADASLYGQSVVLPRQAAVCAERSPDYAGRFQRAYDAWRAENAQRIAIGSKFVHDSAAKGGVDADAGVLKLGDAEVERLRKTTPELLAKHCALLLETLAPPAN
ncbi:MAG: hypothetical protein ABJD97_15620 [Betaproteobacteria bacterium]